MDLGQFIATLATLKDRGWQVRGDGYLRDKDNRCPIMAVAGENNDTGWQHNFISGSKALGLKETDIYAIMQAADLSPLYDPKVRRRLLAAVGLDPDPKEV